MTGAVILLVVCKLGMTLPCFGTNDVIAGATYPAATTSLKQCQMVQIPNYETWYPGSKAWCYRRPANS